MAIHLSTPLGDIFHKVFEIRIPENIYYIELKISFLCETIPEISKHKVFLNFGWQSF